MNDLYKHFRGNGNVLIVGNRDTGKTELLKNIITRDINENKIINIVLDTTGEYKSLHFAKNRAISYFSFKSIDEIKLQNITRCRVIIYDLSLMNRNMLSEATELLINKISMITHKRIRLVIDTTHDFNVNLSLNDILAQYIQKKTNLSFVVVTVDAYGLYEILSMFDVYVVFNISPLTRTKLKDYITVDLLDIGIMLQPFNLILHNVDLDFKTIKNIRNERIGLRQLS